MIKNRHRINVITIILVICIIFVLPSCNKNKEEQEKQTEEISHYIEIKDTTDNDTQDTATPDTTEQADTTELEDTEDQPYIQENDGLFKFNEKGAVIGSPADYDSIVISVGGHSYTAKEYFTDNKKAVADWTPTVINKAIKESHSENGVSAGYDDKDQLNTLIFMANPDFVSYGSDYGIYTDIAGLDFSINGIALGSRVEEMESIFGTNHSIIPYYEGSVRNVYFFENTGSLEFRSLKGVILDIDIYLAA